MVTSVVTLAPRWPLKYHEGSAVKIRYHPQYPDDVWRWLE